MSDASAEEQLAALRTAFAERLGQILSEMETAADRIIAPSDDDTAHRALETLHRLGHTLAGSSGSFGYPTVGKSARHLENFCAEYVERKTLPPRERFADFRDLIADIRRAIESGD